MELEVKGELKEKEPLSKHTTLRLGGKAQYFLYAEDIDDIIKSISFCDNNRLPYYVIGRGSNVLFLDDGFNGMVITTERLDRIEVDENIILVQAGASLEDVINRSKIESLSGLESLIGIPGTVGGAVVMNAGAYGCEIGGFVSAVSVIRRGDIIQLKDFNFGYRDSSLKGKIILDVTLKLNRGNRDKIETKMHEVLKTRMKNLPQLPDNIGTCGSVFKNPVNSHAGMLIEKSGLKGLKIGGSMISREHANYIITEMTANSKDVVVLIRKVRKKVYEKFGIMLKTEVVIVGKEKEIQI
jgi:UDP-N-acetylmuramate dehydrogenase